MSVQGASLVIDRDGNVEAFQIANVTAVKLALAQLALLDAQASMARFALMVGAGLIEPPAEDPADPKTSNVEISLVADFGDSTPKWSYVDNAMTVAGRDWAADYYRRAIQPFV